MDERGRRSKISTAKNRMILVKAIDLISNI
jgi:hypothetical protein